MRMRNKKWALPYLEQQNHVVIQDPSINKGKWKSELNKDILHLEIGTGKGDYITQMRLKDENIGWIGMEKDANVACLAIKKIVDNNIDNILYINNDAYFILDYFANKEINTIHLNFSDPWPKRSHTKRRLSSTIFLDKYYNILEDGGFIIMKTDNSKLFEFSLVEFLKHKFVLENVWVDFRRDSHDEDAITEYETKFMDLGQPIYRAIFKKVV
jgi:tRNA (guanine-N7-)-methyltransferase